VSTMTVKSIRVTYDHEQNSGYVRVTYDHGQIIRVTYDHEQILDMSVSPMIMKKHRVTYDNAERFASPMIVKNNGKCKNVYVRVTYDHEQILGMSVSPIIMKIILDMSVTPMIMKQVFGVNAKAQASANFRQNSRGCKGANVLL